VPAADNEAADCRGDVSPNCSTTHDVTGSPSLSSPKCTTPGSVTPL
jgi:hypothetical protein